MNKTNTCLFLSLKTLHKIQVRKVNILFRNQTRGLLMTSLKIVQTLLNSLLNFEKKTL